MAMVSHRLASTKACINPIPTTELFLSLVISVVLIVNVLIPCPFHEKRCKQLFPMRRICATALLRMFGNFCAAHVRREMCGSFREQEHLHAKRRLSACEDTAKGLDLS
eukprot:235647-Amphidinium_carterae.1